MWDHDRRTRGAHCHHVGPAAALVADPADDPALKALAYDIESGQTAQIGRMQGWLGLWNAAPFPTGGYIRWMPHTGMGHATNGAARMPGMANQEELARFRASAGPGLDCCSYSSCCATTTVAPPCSGTPRTTPGNYSGGCSRGSPAAGRGGCPWPRGDQEYGLALEEVPSTAAPVCLPGVAAVPTVSVHR